MFKVGDRVNYNGSTECWEEIIKSIDCRGYIQGYNCAAGYLSGFYVSPGYYTLIEKGGSMNQYDSLKQRIERVTAWDKEADDILHEINVSSFYALKIVCSNRSETKEKHIQILEWNKEKVYEAFYYNSQCEKLEAFKKALTWLLDNSDIKKDEKKEKIKELEEKVKDLQKEIEELK